MGTRGAWGFKYNGEYKVTYNHFDSYPMGLGRAVVDFLRNTHSRDELEWIFNRIKLVDEREPADAQEALEAMRYVEPVSGVSTRLLTDWYVILRNAQMEPELYRQGLPFMIDNQDFLTNDAFCEWAYIIDLDKGVLEVYYHTKFVEEFPVLDIPDTWEREVEDKAALMYW